LPERYRDFDAERKERMDVPMRFRLGGEDFTVAGGLPASAVFDLAIMSEADGDKAFLAFRDFLLAILPNDEERLMSVLRRTRVQMDELAELVKWIVTEAVARPTTRRSDSSASSRKTGRASKVVSLSPGTKASTG